MSYAEAISILNAIRRGEGYYIPTHLVNAALRMTGDLHE